MNMKLWQSSAVLIAALAVPGGCGSASAGEQGTYDFFERAQYPGNRLRPEVELSEIEQEGGPDATGYNRRTVTFWPRQGIDIIPETSVKHAPLRTWTRRTEAVDPMTIAGSRKRWASDVQPTFKAHLLAFRGVANPYGDPFDQPYDRGAMTPGAVLRLEDGTKRLFTQGQLCDEDQSYLMGVYLKAIEAARGTLREKNRELHPTRTVAKWPDNAKPGEPGIMRYEGPHFVYVSGSQGPLDGSSPWVNAKEQEKTALYRKSTLATAEDFWTYLEYAGSRMPYWDKGQAYKYEITVAGTVKNGFEDIHGFAGGGYGGCILRGAGGPRAGGLFHEWGHGHHTHGWMGVGSGEILADGHACIGRPETMKYYNNVYRPYRNCFNWIYPTAMFYSFTGDDPNWGYGTLTTMSSIAGQYENTPFHTYARIGQERGLWKNGIKGVGDLVGEFYARQAEFDTENQLNLRHRFLAVCRNQLEPVDRARGIYRIPASEAPEPFGGNIIRLDAGKGAREITADLRGYYSPEVFSDWRACIVAVGADGKCRYSPMWNKGSMSMATKPGDQRYWLTVAATPQKLPMGKGKRQDWYTIRTAYMDRFAERYPWEVTLTGATPGTPHIFPADADNMELQYPETMAKFFHNDNGIDAVMPEIVHPIDTPEGVAMRKKLLALKPKLPYASKLLQSKIAAGEIDKAKWGFVNWPTNVRALEWRIDWHLANMQGARHANGGGWVARSATVAPSAYVGPNAMVLDHATVLDGAVIDDNAVVLGEGAVVGKDAKVFGQAFIAGNVQIAPNVRVSRDWILWKPHIVNNREKTDIQFSMNYGSGYAVTASADQRLHQEEDRQTLHANYAFDRAEAYLLEDYYRDLRIVNTFFTVKRDGVLIGGPTFGRRGDEKFVTFDGKTQYAEGAPDLGDLEAITIDTRIGVGGDGTLFDFGTSSSNYFSLRLAGGQCVLTTVRDGKSKTLSGKADLTGGAWHTVRVELDGKTTAIVVDGNMIAKTQSDFRAMDVYPGGADKRNFIAAGRDGANPLACSMDYFRVYQTVYDEFASVPAPPMNSSRRVDPEFLATYGETYGDFDDRKRAAEKASILEPDPQYYVKLETRDRARIKELTDTDSVNALQATLVQLKAAADRRKQELENEFRKKPEVVAKMKRDRELHGEMEARWQKVSAANAEFQAKSKDRSELHKKENAYRQEAEKQPAAQALRAKLKEQEAAQRVVAEAALAGSNHAELSKKRDAAWKVTEEIRRARDTETDAAKKAALTRELQAAETAARHADSLRNDLRNRIVRGDPQWQAMEEKLRKDRDLHRDMVNGFMDSDPACAKMRKTLKRLNEEINEMWHAIRAGDPEIARMEAERVSLRTDQDRRAYAEKGVADASAKMKAIENQLNEAILMAAAGVADEYTWLQWMAWHYRYFQGTLRTRSLAAKGLDREPITGHGIHGMKWLEQAHYWQNEARWTAVVDWDSRVPQEITGQVKPAHAEWLKRIRGGKELQPSAKISVETRPAQQAVKPIARPNLDGQADEAFTVLTRPKPKYDRTIEISKGEEIKLAKIPAGTFVMGSPADEIQRGTDEAQHTVTISKPFWMGVYEVTQGEFYALHGMVPDEIATSTANTRNLKGMGGLHKGGAFFVHGYRGLGKTEDYPMESVTFARAEAFCKMLTDRARKAGTLPAGYVYRLPTEAEWEYACRAGEKGPYNIPGDVEIKAFARVSVPDVYALDSGWEEHVVKTCKVGERKPNAFGLFDMHGNVSEWCLDWYGDYDTTKATDPTGPTAGKRKVLRGGNVFSGYMIPEERQQRFIRSASRFHLTPEVNYGICGFRVVLGAELK